MTIVLVGLNHRTAPVELRERVSLSGCALQMALEELPIRRHHDKPENGSGALGAKVFGLHEAVILSTCNRTEIYAIVGAAAEGCALITGFVARLQDIPLETLQPHLYFMEGDAAARHLMRVACGLDSMVLGEPQILGQVAHAFDEANTMHAAGAFLSHLFTQALHAGKRARTETGISRHSTSVSHTVAQLAKARLGSLSESHVLVVGAGEMAALAAQALRREGATHMKFINRTFNRAERLAQDIGGEAYGWTHLPEALEWADVVVSATGAPHTVIYAADVEPTLPHRGTRPLLFIDIAVPRDIEHAVSDLPGVTRCDIDALQSTVDQHLLQRQAAVPQVERIIDHELATFLHWSNSRRVAPVISKLQRRARTIADAEVAEALGKLKHADAQTEQVINRLAHRLVQKLLHEPTVRLKSSAAEGDGCGYAEALSELFALNEFEAGFEVEQVVR